MIIYFYLFVTFLYVLTTDSVSVRGRNVKNDLVPFWSSRLESLRKDANSLKVLSNEPFVIQFRVPPTQDGGREDEGRDKKRRRLSKKRIPKLKSLRKKHRIRRDVQIPVVETASGYQTRKSNRLENSLREAAKPKNSTNHIWTVYDVKTSDRQKELMRDFAQVLQKEKSLSKHKEPKSLKKDDGKNSLDKLRQKSDNSNRIAHRHNVPSVKAVHPTTPKTVDRTSSKYTSRDLKADRERVEDKMRFLTSMLSSNDSVGDGPRVRRKAESDRVVNKIAKMFLTLSAMNGMHDKRKSKCEEEEEDEDDVWTQEARNNPTRKNYSSNEERYKFKKWIEQMKSKRTSRTCPCMTQDYDEENDVFPLEQKLSKDNPPLHRERSSEEVSSESFREKNFFFYPSTQSRRNFLYKPRYTNAYEDLDKKLVALTTRGRRKLELPMEDLELYRSRAKQILQNAEDILDKIKEEEEKRQVAPNVLLSQLKELTSRIQPDPRNNENDLMRLIQKNLGLAKAQGGLDWNSISDNLKSFLVVPYEKAKALTDDSTRKLSTYILKNFGKLNVSGDQDAVTDKEHRQGDAQIYQGQEPQHKDGPLSSANLEKEPEKVSVSESLKPDIGPVTNFGEKKTDGVPEDATQDPIKQRIDQMLREQEEKIRNYTESSELSEGAEEQEKVAAQPDRIVDDVTSPIEGERFNEKDSGDPTTSTPEKPGDPTDEVQGNISGSDPETEEETLQSVRESNLDDLTKSSEIEGVTLKTVRESNLEDLNINDGDADGEDRQEANFSERDENDVTASKYLQQRDYFKGLVNDENGAQTEKAQILEDVEKALDNEEPRDDDKVQEILSESNQPEELKTESEEALEAKHAPEETGEEGEEAGVEVLVNAPDPETTAADLNRDENDVIASKYLMKEEAGKDKEEEVPDKLTEESQEVGSKEEPQNNETEKPVEDMNEKNSKENVGEILDEDPYFLDPEKKSKVEITDLTNDEILEKSLKEGETVLSEAIEAEDLPNEENKEPEGAANKEAGESDVVQTPAENPTESISEEQQDHFIETLVRKLEDEELEDKVEALNKPEKIEDEDLKNEDETAKAEEDPSLRSANPEKNSTEKEYESLMEEVEDLIKVGKLLEKLTDEAELGIQDNENYNEKESGETQVRATNPSQDEENSGEDNGVEQREIDPSDELPNQEEEREGKGEVEEISLRAENPTKDEAEDPANIDETDENLNGDETDDPVLKETNTNADQDSDVKNDEEPPSEKTNSSEEPNREANDSIDIEETPLKSANPIEEIKAEVEETNMEDEAHGQAAQSGEADDEATNKGDETPLKSAHQELEAEDGNTDVEDEANIRSARPFEAGNEENNQKGEATLRSEQTDQELQGDGEDTNNDDYTYLESENVGEENGNTGDETPLRAENPNEDIEGDREDTMREANPSGELPEDGNEEDFKDRSANLEANNQVAEEIEDENANDETPLKATNTPRDPENQEYQNLVEEGFDEAVKAGDPSLNAEHSKNDEILESTNENRTHESARPAGPTKLNRGEAESQSGFLKLMHSLATGSGDVDHLPVPHEIENIMKDIEGKNDDVTFKNLNPEQIDRFIHKMGKVEEENIKEAEEEDCMKECKCSEAMHVRSRNLGKYEIVKDFLHWVKHIQLTPK